MIDVRPHIAGNIYTEKVEGIDVIGMELISFIQIMKRYGSSLINFENSIILLIPRWRTIKGSSITCRST